MKKFTKKAVTHNGGVLILSAILALSLMFASCANSSDSDSDNNDGNNTGITDTNNGNSNGNNSNNSNSNSNGNNGGNSSSNNGGNSSSNNGGSSNDNNDSNNSSGNNNNSNGGNNNNNNSSSTLPVSVGNNPITETVKLYYGDISDRYLELESDGTARYIRERNEGREIEAQFSYTYNVNEKTISMKIEKYFYDPLFTHEEGKLLTYNEILSKINEEATVENARQFLKEYYEEECEGKDWFNKEYPDCSSYDDWEKTNIESGGFTSFDDYVKHVKQNYEDMHKVIFSAQTTYAYEIEDGKITLAEKFTGVKNMFMESGCEYFNSESSYGVIYNRNAYIMENDVYYTGIPNTEKNTISFVPDVGGKKVNATYDEDIAQETVTISFDGKNYVCEFEGRTFIQE